MDAMAARTKYFSIPADNPSSRCGKVQVSNFSLNLTVDAGSFLAAFLTDRSKTSVGFRLYKGFGCFRGMEGRAEDCFSRKGSSYSALSS